MPVGTKKDAKRNGSLVFCMIRVESMINLKNNKSLFVFIGFRFSTQNQEINYYGPHNIRVKIKCVYFVFHMLISFQSIYYDILIRIIHSNLTIPLMSFAVAE